MVEILRLSADCLVCGMIEMICWDDFVKLGCSPRSLLNFRQKPIGLKSSLSSSPGEHSIATYETVKWKTASEFENL